MEYTILQQFRKKAFGLTNGAQIKPFLFFQHCIYQAKCVTQSGHKLVLKKQ